MSKFIDFAELKENISIEEVVTMLNLEMTDKGNQLRGKCPTCGDGGERTLVVTPSKQAFYCFAKKTGGDLIALAAHILNAGQKEAAQAIADGNCTVPGNSTDTGTVPPERVATGKLQPLTYLKTEHEALDGLDLDVETLEHFEAGYASKGIMRGRLAVPIHDLMGNLVAYCGIAVKGDQRPFLSFPKGFESDQYLWNAHRVSTGELYCTEHPLAAMWAFQHGVENVVSRFETPKAEVISLHASA